MVSVEVSDADPADMAGRHAGELHLALRSLPRIEQQALAVPPEEVAVVVAAASRNLARGAENHEFPVGHGTDPTPGRQSVRADRIIPWEQVTYLAASDPLSTGTVPAACRLASSR